MAEMVFAAGAPHAPGLVGLLGAAPADVKDVVQDMYAAIRTRLLATKPDVLIIVANDHLANSRVRCYPDFLIGMAPEHKGPYEWFKEWIGCRDYVVPGRPELSEAIFRGMNRRGHRLFAERENLRFDDNVSVPSVMLELDTTGVALIPILQNCTVPPFPDQRQSYEFGQALAEVIRDELPAGLRVALLGSGGLSHEPGGARYFFIDRDFDLWFLELMASGDHERVLRELTIDRMENAGAGGTSELLAWLVVLGAIGPCKGMQSGYAVHADFKCGIGGVIWDLHGSKFDASSAPPAPPPPAALPLGDPPPAKLADFDPTLAGHDLVQDLKWNPSLREEFAASEALVLDRYALRPQERAAIEQRDFRTLYDMGFHPYLGGQLARFIFGNTAGKGATVAVRKLVDSLRGKQADEFDKDQGVVKQ
ncbi:hypothetical protein ACO2Q9_14385 [Variovorax sp. VNK109]|uniref:DODA-type extradiol aromatic ring-opening family dioxygenase n=1 Tax=Variovorax sp. VNK109 TaxID=3400919 RepID=UPI003BFE0355